MEKAEVSVTFFVSEFTSKCSSQPAPVTEDKGRNWEHEEVSCAEDHIQDHPKNLKVYKSTRSDGMQPQLWQYSEVLTDWKRVNMTP